MSHVINYIGTSTYRMELKWDGFKCLGPLQLLLILPIRSLLFWNPGV